MNKHLNIKDTKQQNHNFVNSEKSAHRIKIRTCFILRTTFTPIKRILTDSILQGGIYVKDLRFAKLGAFEIILEQTLKPI